MRFDTATYLHRWHIDGTYSIVCIPGRSEDKKLECKKKEKKNKEGSSLPKETLLSALKKTAEKHRKTTPNPSVSLKIRDLRTPKAVTYKRLRFCQSNDSRPGTRFESPRRRRLRVVIGKAVLLEDFHRVLLWKNTHPYIYI